MKVLNGEKGESNIKQTLETEKNGMNCTKEEIEWAIERLKNGKTPGADGIRAEIRKKVPTDIGNCLVNLLREVVRERKIPEK